MKSTKMPNRNTNKLFSDSLETHSHSVTNMPTPSILFPSRDQLVEISRSSGGDLSEIPFGVVLLALAETKTTCVLEVRRGDLIKKIAVEAGQPVQCRSNVLHDTFTHYLRNQDLMLEEDIQTCIDIALKRKVPIGDILLERRLLTGDQILAQLQKLLAKLLLDVFAWPDGTFVISDDRATVQAPLKIKVRQLVLTGLTRFAPQVQVDRALGQLDDSPLAVDPHADDDERKLRLDSTAQQIVQALAEPQSPNVLADTLEIDERELLRSIYVLGALGVIAPAALLEEGFASAAADVPESEPAAPESQATARQISQDELSGLYLNHLRLDAFELLQLHDEADTDAIASGYLDFLHKIFPWTTPSQAASKQTTEQARALLLAGAKAFAVLADETARDRLLRQRFGVLGVEPADDPDELQMLDPAEQFSKGVDLMESGQYDRAIKRLELASDSDPQHGIYSAQSAYCYYLQSPDHAEKSLEALTETHRLDPNCGLAFLYAGEIAGQLGRFEEAQTWLRQASKLMAPDRRPIDKLKDLQRLRKAGASK